MEILTNATKNYLKKLSSVLFSSNSSWNFHSKMAAAPPSGCYQKSIRVPPLVLGSCEGLANGGKEHSFVTAREI